MEPRSRNDWLLVHALAIITAATTAIYIWLYTKFDLTAADPGIPPSTALIALIGTIAMFWFWFRMLAACVRDRPAQRAIIWGWVLVIAFMFGALAYFIGVWRPAHRPG